MPLDQESIGRNGLASGPRASGNGCIDLLVDLPAGDALRYRLNAQVSAGVSMTQTGAAAGTIESNAADNAASHVDAVVASVVFVNGFEN